MPNTVKDALDELLGQKCNYFDLPTMWREVDLEPIIQEVKSMHPTAFPGAHVAAENEAVVAYARGWFTNRRNWTLTCVKKIFIDETETIDEHTLRLLFRKSIPLPL